MNFSQAVSSAFNKYATFSGRASRSEYWYWILFYFIAYAVAITIDTVVISSFIQMAPLTIITALGCLLPGLAVWVRRLHDVDRSAWWLLIVFVPLVGGILLLIWQCTKGTPGPNRFGPDPLGGVQPMGAPAARRA